MSLARLLQPLLSPNNVMAGVVEIHEADPAWFNGVNMPAFDISGLWQPVGVLEPKSLKPDFADKFFDVETGFPATVKKSYKTASTGKISFQLEEMTSLWAEMAAGGAQDARIYSALAGTTVGANTATGSVSQVQLVSGGAYDYTAVPTATIAAPTGSGPVQATLDVVLNANGTIDLVITNAGAGYLVNPAVTITGGTSTGTPPTANAFITTTQTQFTVASVSGLAIGNEIEVQFTPSGGVATLNYGDTAQPYNNLMKTFITAISGTTLTCYPLIPGLPLASTGTVKRIGGSAIVSGTNTIRQKSYRLVFFATDGSQFVSYVPLARSAGGVKLDYQYGAKNMLIPVELSVFGVPVLSTDSYFGATHTGEPMLAYHYILRDQGVTGASATSGLPLAV